jgi:hypothetical protein
MRIFEKAMEDILKRLIKIDVRQFGFRPGKSTTDAVFILRQMQEKFEQKKIKLYHALVYLEKAFDWVTRGIIEWSLRRQGMPERLIALTITVYLETRPQVGTVAGSFRGI